MKMEFFGTATLGTKGQVVIPAKARDAFELKEGDKLLVFGEPINQKLCLTTANSLENLMNNIQNDLSNMKKLVDKNDGGKNE